MSIEQDIKDLLIEIRDNQRTSLARQEEHLGIARDQVDRTRQQVAESIELQKQAMAKVKKAGIVLLPVIALCLGLIAFLIVRQFWRM